MTHSAPYAASDEQRRRDLVAELEDLTARREAALAALESTLRAAGMESAALYAKAMAAHAEMIRDALQPFDSGVRPDSKKAD